MAPLTFFTWSKLPENISIDFVAKFYPINMFDREKNVVDMHFRFLSHKSGPLLAETPKIEKINWKGALEKYYMAPIDVFSGFGIYIDVLICNKPQ